MGILLIHIKLLFFQSCFALNFDFHIYALLGLAHKGYEFHEQRVIGSVIVFFFFFFLCDLQKFND